MGDSPMVRFGSGEGTAIIIGTGAALVVAGSTSPAVVVIESGLSAAQPLEQIMTDLSSVGFALLPSFAIAIADGASIHFVHRGNVTVHVVALDESISTFSNPSIMTWREEVVDSVAEVRVEIDGAAPGTPFWIGGGLVPAARLIWPLAASKNDIAWPPGLARRSIPVSPATLVEPSLLSAAAEKDVSPIEVLAGAPTVELRPPGHGVSATPFLTAPVGMAAGGEADDLDFSNLVHHTVFRHVEDAAVRVAESADEDHQPLIPSNGPSDIPAPLHSEQGSSVTIMPDRTDLSAEPSMISGVPLLAGLPRPVTPLGNSIPDDDPDHDGHTVARPRKKQTRPASLPALSISVRPPVQAVRCGSGHLNPPNAQACRVCGTPIVDRSSFVTPRPSLGVLRFSTSQTVALDGPILIGRNPPPGQKVDGEVAEAVAIDNSELSRFHAAVHVTEWYVYVADQGSTNGTIVRVPGKPDQTLRPYEKVQISPDMIIDLGGAVTFQYSKV